MTLNILGNKIKIRTEAVIAGIACLVLLGCLSGYVFFSNRGEIIIEAGAGAEFAKNGTGEASAGEVTGTVPVESVGEPAGATAAPGNGTGTNGTAGITAEADGGTAETGSSRKPVKFIKIYVVGCVNNPGIVTLEKGQLIYDAVMKAGGPAEDADLDNINMVYELNENVMLYIKPKKETAREEETGKSIPAEPSAGKSGTGSGAAVISGTGSGAVITGDDENTGESVKAAAGKNLVNINTASIAELDTLPGIGEATAKDIIAYREKHGGFKKIEDIMKVPRIKQNRFQSIKDYITVD